MALNSSGSFPTPKGAGTSSWLQFKPHWLVLICAVVFTAFYNAPFYKAIEEYVGFGQPLLMVKLAFLLLLVNHLLISLFSFRFALKPFLIFLFFAAAFSSYFMNAYGTLIDKHMLQNAMETDINEVRGLLSVSLLIHTLIFFVVPVAILYFVRIKWPPGFRKITHWLLPIVADIALVLLLALTSYDEMASTFRNHRDIKDMVVPVSSVSALVSVGNKAVAAQFPVEYQQKGLDAKVSPAASERDKPNLVVFVLGETARADHFTLNGYDRDTTPRLNALAAEPDSNLVNFPKASSCGTATAFSVPCMFSWVTRSDYDESVAKNSDNLLDIMVRAGIDASWLDNQSGCKDMCNRIPTSKPETPALCKGEYCEDLVLIDGARKVIDKNGKNDQFLVLHQLGSHGPEYYKRSKPDQKAFKPECESNELQSCDQQTIINAYDNSIRVTDDMLGQTVDMLKSLSSRYNVAMVYMSDHGESLGENGIYLHGIPYLVAPEEQTHVPFVMWLSDGFQKANHIDMACLAKEAQKPVSQDNLFSSLLGMMNVQTKMIQPDLNLFSDCRSG